MRSRASEVSPLVLRLIGCASMNRVLRSTTVFLLGQVGVALHVQLLYFWSNQGGCYPTWPKPLGVALVS